MLPEWIPKCKIHRYRGCAVCPVEEEKTPLVRFPYLDHMSPQDYIRYAKLNVAGCPVCRSRNIVHEHVNQSADFVIDQSVYCNDCDSVWEEEFHMVTYHSVKLKREKPAFQQQMDQYWESVK